MKKAYTRGDKLLFLSPLFFLMLAGAVWIQQKTAPETIELPVNSGPHLFEYSPDGQRLVVFNLNSSRAGAYGYLYDAKTRSKILDLVPQTGELNNLQAYGFGEPTWSPDGKSIAISMAAPLTAATVHPVTQKLVIWDTASGTIRTSHLYKQHESQWLGYHNRFSADGKRLIGNGVPPAIVEVATGKRLNKPDGGVLQSPEYSQLNEKLGLIACKSPTEKSALRVVDARTKRLVWQPQPQLGRVDGFEWFGDVLMVYGAVNKTSAMYVNGVFRPSPHRRILWDGKTRQLLPALPLAPDETTGQYSFHPDHRTIAHAFQKSIRRGKSIESKVILSVWDYRGKRELWRTETTEPLFQPQWSPDGKCLMVLGALPEYNNLYVFDSKGKLRLKRGPVSRTNRWSPDSKQLATLVVERDNAGTRVSSRIEIHRFDD